MIIPLVIVLFAMTEVQATDFSGTWKGTWRAAPSQRHAREHGGSLRVRLKSTGNGTYRGRFSGRFAVVLPYFYRAEAVQIGNTLVATKRLGPLGEYTMRLSSPSPNVMQGRWIAFGQGGTIGLHRK